MTWVLLGAAGIGELACVYQAVRLLRRVALAGRLLTSTVRDITRPGLYEVYGEVVCPQPRKYKGFDCVWFRYELKRRVHTGRHSRWVTEYAEADSTPFMIRDETGCIGVEPDRADVDARPLAAERHNPRGLIAGLTEGPTQETLRGITVGSRVYVAGPVVQEGTVLSFERRGGPPLLISCRSERALSRSLLRRAFGYTLLALILPAVAWLVAVHGPALFR